MKKLVICLSAIALLSCGESSSTENNNTTTATEEVQPAEQPPQPEATPEVSTTPEVATTNSLSSKTLNEQIISVTKAQVTGKVLYVELAVKTTGNSSLNVINVKEINYVDDAEAKKHEVLKDDEGIYQASPLQGSKSNKLQVSLTGAGSEKLINLRFAAPPETSKTITLNMPDFGSFDAIPISR